MATTLSVGLVQSLPPAPLPFEIRTQHSKFFLNTGLTSPICEHEPPTDRDVFKELWSLAERETVSCSDEQGTQL